jgi:hypothetical protein
MSQDSVDRVDSERNLHTRDNAQCTMHKAPISLARVTPHPCPSGWASTSPSRQRASVENPASRTNLSPTIIRTTKDMSLCPSISPRPCTSHISLCAAVHPPILVTCLQGRNRKSVLPLRCERPSHQNCKSTTCAPCVPRIAHTVSFDSRRFVCHSILHFLEMRDRMADQPPVVLHAAPRNSEAGWQRSPHCAESARSLPRCDEETVEPIVYPRKMRKM